METHKIQISLLLVLAILISGCVTTKTKGKVTFTDTGAIFELDKSGKIYCKDGDKEAYYDTQTPSLLRTLVESVAVREMNKD